jgi:hypothetical protein
LRPSPSGDATASTAPASRNVFRCFDIKSALRPASFASSCTDRDGPGASSRKTRQRTGSLTAHRNDGASLKKSCGTGDSSAAGATVWETSSSMAPSIKRIRATRQYRNAHADDARATDVYMHKDADNNREHGNYRNEIAYN